MSFAVMFKAHGRVPAGNGAVEGRQSRCCSKLKSMTPGKKRGFCDEKLQPRLMPWGQSLSFRSCRSDPVRLVVRQVTHSLRLEGVPIASD